MLVDKKGPKKVIISGFFLQAVGILLLVNSASIVNAVIGVSVLSSGTTSIVTADRVFFYALHDKYDQVSSYNKNFSTYFSCRLIGGTVASILCTLLFMQNIEYAFYSTIFLNVIAVMAGFYLENILPANMTDKSFCKLLKYSYLEISRNTMLKSLIKYNLAIVTVYLILYMQIQQYLFYINFDISYSGIIYAVLGILSPALAKITSRVKLLKVYRVVPVLTILSLVLMATIRHPISVIFLLLYWSIYGIVSPKVDSEIDASIKGDETSRGSIISYVIIFQNMIIAIMLIINGYIIENLNMGVLIMGYSVVYLLLSIGCTKLLSKLFKQVEGSLVP